MEKSGRIEKRIIGRGTKSERPAMVLVTPEAEYILRRAGEHPLADEVLESMAGRQVSCEGQLLAGSTFEAHTINPKASDSG
ncbi:MAG TPA: hypothetical protein VF988_01500 [Verrucomicrobiae bacterium]